VASDGDFDFCSGASGGQPEIVREEAKIVEGHLMPDHVHMMISIPPKYAVARPLSVDTRQVDRALTLDEAYYL
jgi:transposase IS200 family protein